MVQDCWTPTVVAAGTGDVQGVVATPRMKLMGVGVAETAGTAAAAEVTLHHGTSSSGPLLCPSLNLTADGCTIFPLGGGIPCPNGIYVNRVSGNSELILYTHNG